MAYVQSIVIQAIENLLSETVFGLDSTEDNVADWKYIENRPSNGSVFIRRFLSNSFIVSIQISSKAAF